MISAAVNPASRPGKRSKVTSGDGQGGHGLLIMYIIGLEAGGKQQLSLKENSMKHKHLRMHSGHSTGKLCCSPR